MASHDQLIEDYKIADQLQQQALQLIAACHPSNASARPQHHGDDAMDTDGYAQRTYA